MRKTTHPLLFALFLALPLAACDDATSPTPLSPGAVTVLLTWEPGTTLDEAWVDITSVYLQTDITDPAETREHLFRRQGGFNVQAQLGDVTLTTDTAVTPGLYRSVHIVFSDACVLTDEGRPFTSSDIFGPCGRDDVGVLRLSDGNDATAAVRIGRFEIASGDSETIRLDLDVGESFARTESGWIFDPLVTPQP